MASITSIPQFLLPRGIPSANAFRTLRNTHRMARTSTRCASSSFSSSSTAKSDGKPLVLEKPDKFRPPSHPQRRVVQTRDGRVIDSHPVNYGPKLTAKEKEEQKHRKYPNMFPPEGTVMHKFLTSRWIHIWIAMGVLTSLATFTFTSNFKRTSPFAHLLPPWSALFSHPIDTISQALSVYKMHVQHNSMLTREKRHRRIDDAEKRRQYRIAHGLEEPETAASTDGLDVVDDQSPVAVPVASAEAGPQGAATEGDYVDWEGRKRPVKKWLGIW